MKSNKNRGFKLKYFKTIQFIRRVRKIAKSDYYFVKAVRLPVCVEQLGSQLTDFHEILYLSIFRKSVEKNISFIQI